jgi:adenosylcobinamide-GDP ribazoletransferase
MREHSPGVAGHARNFAGDLLVCLRFCTRLPIPVLAFETEPFRPLNERSARVLPIVGAALGTAAALCLGLAAKLGLPAPLPALLALTLLVAMTGALHEDGLADCADGFGGGANAETRLAIMKDSRLGTFGTMALILAFALRAASLVCIAQASLGLAACVLVATAAISRGLALMPLWLLPPARAQGVGLAAARPSQAVMIFAAASAAIFAFVPLVAGASFARILLAIMASLAGAGAVTSIARRAIGGQTGDVAGATQQIAEICAYLVFAAGL